jgi:hypothetical protein
MYLKIVTFVPEELEEIRSRLSTIFPGVTLDYEFIYPVIPTLEELWEELEPTFLERVGTLSYPLKIVHLPTPQLIETLLYDHPPALLVVCYRRLTPRITELVTTLMARNYPLLLLSL